VKMSSPIITILSRYLRIACVSGVVSGVKKLTFGAIKQLNLCRPSKRASRYADTVCERDAFFFKLDFLYNTYYHNSMIHQKSDLGSFSKS